MYKLSRSRKTLCRKRRALSRKINKATRQRKKLRKNCVFIASQKRRKIDGKVWESVVNQTMLDILRNALPTCREYWNVLLVWNRWRVSFSSHLCLSCKLVPQSEFFPFSSLCNRKLIHGHKNLCESLYVCD